MPQSCSTCGQEFDDKRSMRIHHSTAHDEHLLNQECANCGNKFHNEYEVKYCSDECREACVSFEGESNPNYRGAKERTACEICGDEFEYYPSEKPGLYCSDCVETEEWQPTPDMEGPANPRWSGGAREVDCAACGATLERTPRELSGEIAVCGRECQYEWLSEAFTGEDHPNWKGGSDANYGPGWNAVREAALERDGYACVACGVTSDELGRNPDVHHVVPVRAFVASPVMAEADAHTLDNVASLCPTCHRTAEFGGIPRGAFRALVGPVRRGEPEVGPRFASEVVDEDHRLAVDDDVVVLPDGRAEAVAVVAEVLDDLDDRRDPVAEPGL